jgi:hypothetical protein
LPVDTIVPVEVVQITEKEAQSTKGNWMKLEFKFTIADLPDSLMEEYAEVIGSPIWGSVSARLSEHKDNKLRQWAEAIFGVELNVGYELDTDDLIGKKARAVISQYTKRDGGQAHQVDALLPFSATFAPTNHTITEDPWTSKEPASVGVSASQSALAAFDEEPPF